ncbi:MAG TPA: hypothetical protein VKB88_04470 [Bryobacteraceae bacterium]|nr:hypothetical protein [Bryobacteraceae bacterium]
MLLIQYRTGLIQEGVLLSIKGNELRIAVKGEDDVLRFRWLQEGWTSESHEIATFAFPLAAFEAIGMVPTSGNTLPEQAVQEVGPWNTRTLVS